MTEETKTPLEGLKPVAWIMRDWKAGKIDVTLSEDERSTWERRGAQIEPLYALQAAEASQARQRELEEALRPFVNGYSHTEVFLRSRERMHPDGQALYRADVQRATDLLARLAASGPTHYLHTEDCEMSRIDASFNCTCGAKPELEGCAAPSTTGGER